MAAQGAKGMGKVGGQKAPGYFGVVGHLLRVTGNARI